MERGHIAIFRKDIELPERLSVAAQGQAYDGRFRFPSGVVITRIKPQKIYNVTDAGIVAGETAGGLVQQMRLEETVGRKGRKRGPRFGIFRDELIPLSNSFKSGLAASLFSEALPATTVQERSWWDIHCVVNTIGRIMELYTDWRAATEEWAGATAYVADDRVYVDYIEPETPKEVMELSRQADSIVDRYFGASQVSHQINITPGSLTKHVYIDAGAAARRIATLSYSGDKASRFGSLGSQNETEKGRSSYAAWKQVAPTEEYLFRNIDIPSQTHKRIDFDLDAAGTPLAFVQGLEA